MPGKEAPEPATTGADVLCTQPLAHFIQGQVWLRADQRQQQPGMLFQSRLAAPAPCRRRTPALLPALHPSDRRAGADRKSLPRRPARGPLRDGFDNTLTQILRTRLGHRSSPISDAARIAHPTRFENPLRFNHAETCSKPILIDAANGSYGQKSHSTSRAIANPKAERPRRVEPGGRAMAAMGASRSFRAAGTNCGLLRTAERRVRCRRFAVSALGALMAVFDGDIACHRPRFRGRLRRHHIATIAG